MKVRAVALLWCGIASLGFTSWAVGQTPQDRQTPISRAVAKVKDAVVNLRTMRVVPARFENADSGGRVRGLGTGVIIDPRGYVVTNYHVVEKVDEIHVLTSNGREYPARILTSDTRNDLAVLKMDGKNNLPHIPLYGAGNAIVGEVVFAIGNPYGLENSVTTGIVSAVGRELKLPNGEIFNGLIQTDASINPGNSGGPLLTINGDLLGVNVAIRSNSQGIGFAIPTNAVRKIVETIMGAPPVSVASQGLHIKRGGRDEVEFVGGQELKFTGVRVDRIEPGSVAAKLGFQPGDEVVEISGQEVRTQFDMDRILWDRRVGETLKFKVRRNGTEIKDIDLTFVPPKQLQTDSEILWHILGIKVRPVPAENVRTVLDKLNGGLMLVEVAPNSPAALAKFRPGDILVGLEEWETIEENNVRFVMQWKELPEHQPIKYHLIRNGTYVVGNFQIPAYP